MTGSADRDSRLAGLEATFTTARARGAPVAPRPGGVGRRGRGRGSLAGRTSAPARPRPRTRTCRRCVCGRLGRWSVGNRPLRCASRSTTFPPRSPSRCPAGRPGRRSPTRRPSSRGTPPRRSTRASSASRAPARRSPCTTPPAASSTPCATAPASANPSPCPHSAATSIGYPTTGPGLHRPRTSALPRHRGRRGRPALGPVDGRREPASTGSGVASVDRPLRSRRSGRTYPRRVVRPVPARPAPPATLPPSSPRDCAGKRRWHITIIHVSLSSPPRHPCRPNPRTRTPATGSPTPTYGCGWPSWVRTSPRSNAAAETGPTDACAPRGAVGAAAPSNPWCARSSPCSRPNGSHRDARRSAATGPAPTTPRSTSSRPTAHPSPVAAVGSIKWLEGAAFDHRDLAALTVHRDRLLGAGPDTPLIAASRSGTTTQGIDYAYGPQDLLTAWE